MLDSNGPRFGHLDQLMAERGMIVKQMAASPTSNLLKAEVQSLREISSPPATAFWPFQPKAGLHMHRSPTTLNRRASI